MLKDKVIAITGSAGFIASHLIEELNKYHPKQILNIDLKVGLDLTDLNQMVAFFRNNRVDIVFDLATLPLPVSLTSPYSTVTKIIQMITNLCELCRLGAFKKLIHISSSEAYGTAAFTPMDEEHPLNPRTPYAAGKASGDLIALAYHQTFDIDVVIPRCYNTYGERQPLEWGAVIPKTVCRILQNKPPVIYKDGSQTRDFIYVKDTVRGIVEVAKQKGISGKIVNISRGKEIAITDLIHKICALMNYKGKIQYIKQRQADVSRHRADITLARKLFNFKPEYSLEEGLRRTIKYYVDNISNLEGVYTK